MQFSICLYRYIPIERFSKSNFKLVWDSIVTQSFLIFPGDILKRKAYCRTVNYKNKDILLKAALIYSIQISIDRYFTHIFQRNDCFFTNFCKDPIANNQFYVAKVISLKLWKVNGETHLILLDINPRCQEELPDH